MDEKLLINESSQNKQQITFVYISDNNNDTKDGNELMNRAYDALSSRKFNTIWMSSYDIMNIESYTNYVFIIKSFTGEVFNHLVINNAQIIGPLVTLYCVKFNSSGIICTLLPSKREPIFSQCMNGLTVCVTGFDTNLQFELIRMIRQMGAKFSKHLTTTVTHLVSDTVITEKYFVASKRTTMKVLCSEWVYNCWNIFQYELVNADHITDQFKTPIFNRLLVFATKHQKFDSQKLNEIENIIRSNGGHFYNSINKDLIGIVSKNEAIVLVDKANDNAEALNHGLKCVDIRWLYHSLKTGYALPVKGYVVSGKTGDQCLTNEIEQINGSSDSRQSNNDINRMLDCLQLNESGHNFLIGCSIHANGFSRYDTDTIRSRVVSHGAVFTDQYDASVTHVIVNANDEQSSIEKLRKNALCDTSSCKFVSIEWLYKCLATNSIVDDFNIEVNVHNNKRKAQNPGIPENLVLPKKTREALDKHAKSLQLNKSQINKSIAESFYNRDDEERPPIQWNDEMLSQNNNTVVDLIGCTSRDQNDNMIIRDNELTPPNSGESTLKWSYNWDHNDLLILNTIPNSAKIMLYGYETRKKRELAKIVRNLNGQLIDDSTNNVTHLILKSIDSCTSEKALSAMARGVWILRDDYIYESRDRKKFVNETKYEWSCFVQNTKIQILDNSLCENACLAASEWRQYMADEGKPGAFHNWNVLIIGDSSDLQSNVRILKCGKANIQLIKSNTDLSKFDYAFIDTKQYKPSQNNHQLNELIAQNILYDMDFVRFYLFNGPNDRAINSYFYRYSLKQYLITSYDQFPMFRQLISGQLKSKNKIMK